MTCKACKYDHPPAQDCKVAARIRANVTKAFGIDVTKHIDVTLKPKVIVTNDVRPVIVTADVKCSVTSFEHPNVYPVGDLGWNKIKWPKSPAQRKRESRAKSKKGKI
jgi:hypothetical protein